MVADNNSSEDWLKDLGSRRQTNINVEPNPDTDNISNILIPPSNIKKEPEEDPMDVDDMPRK